MITLFTLITIIYLPSLFLCYLYTRRNMISKWEKYTNSGNRIGVYVNYNILMGKEPIKVTAEVEEIAKAKDKCKITYLNMHISPNKFNNTNTYKIIEEYIGYWVDINHINFYTETKDRKQKINNLLKDL